MAKNRKVQVEYSLVNTTFNKGIKDVNKQVNTLNKEFKLQREQMRNTASESEKYEAQLSKLNKEYELSEQKTRQTQTALENMKEMFGENSEQARVWGDRLLDAQRNQEYLRNSIADTNTRLADAVESESDYAKALRDSAQASEERRTKLADLSDEQDRLHSNTEKLNSQYEYERTALGQNASEISKVRLEKEHLARQSQLTAEQISNLERQLHLAKDEYGENSREVNELEAELYDAKRANEEFTQSLQEKQKYLGIGKDAIRHYGEQLKSVGSAMSKYVTLPLTAGAGVAVKAASDWETAFADVKKTVDGTDEELLAIEEALRGMSTVMPTSASELAEIAANAGQLGIATEDVISFTDTMAKLAETTDMTADSASTAFAQFANVMGTTSDEYGRLGSVIVQLGNNMATTESQTMEMSQRMAAQARVIGLNETQVMALAATLSSVGVNAEAGGSAMTRVFQKLDTSVKGSTEELNGFAEVAGQTAEEFAETWENDPQTAIQNFMEGLGKIQESGGDTAGVLKDLGITSVNEIGALQSLALASDLLGESFTMAGEAYENGLGENSALNQEAQVRFETFASKLEMLRNKLNDIMIDIGGPLIDALLAVLEVAEPFLQWLADMAQRFTEADEGTQRMIVIIGALIAALGPLLMVIGTLITSLTWIIPAVGAVISVFGALISWPGLIIAAIAGLAYAIYQNWDSIVTWTQELWRDIQLYWNHITTSISTAVTGAWDVVKEKFQNIQNWITEKINSARDAVEGAIDAIKGFLNFEWKWPKIPIPRFTFSGSLNPFDWGDSSRRPNIGVNWVYLAKGGIFDSATLFPSGHVVGEAGPEAVIPLNRQVLGDIGRGILESTEGITEVVNNNRAVVVINGMELVVGTRTMARMLIDDITTEQELKVKTENRRKGKKT